MQKPVKLSKQGVPLNVLRDKKSCKEEADATSSEQAEVTTVTPLVVRHKGETKEEKQTRKQLVKQHNKVSVYSHACNSLLFFSFQQRRITKKATQQVYKNEELRQKKLNSKPQSSIIVL